MFCAEFYLWKLKPFGESLQDGQDSCVKGRSLVLQDILEGYLISSLIVLNV